MNRSENLTGKIETGMLSLEIKKICFIPIILLLFNIGIYAENSEASISDAGKLYFLIQLTSGKKARVDFLFVKNSNNKYIDPRIVIEKSGREKFIDKYLKNSKYYFFDKFGSKRLIKSIKFNKKIVHQPPLFPDLRYFYDGEGELNKTSDGDLKGDTYVTSYSEKPPKIGYSSDKPELAALVKKAAQISKEVASAILKERNEFFKNNRKPKIGKIEFVSLQKYRRDFFSNFDIDNKYDYLSSWTLKLRYKTLEGKTLDIFPFPILIFVYGSGNHSVVKKVDNYGVSLHYIRPKALIDIDNNGITDVILHCVYYESDRYSVIKGHDDKNRVLTFTRLRGIE